MGGERTVESERERARRLESLAQLAGGVAHEFNNLLGVVINYAEFVADELPPGSQGRRDLEEIRQAGERGVALTRQLLIFGRRAATKPESLDLNELAAGVESVLRQELGERVELEIVTAGEPSMVEADRAQLEEALVNLAVNARTAMPAGGTLRVETGSTRLDDQELVGGDVSVAAGSYGCLTVSDSGVGMTADVLERAFDPFFSLQPKGRGLGLGLATVHGIVTQAGGHIRLHSELGIGTSVEIYLPASGTRTR